MGEVEEARSTMVDEQLIKRGILDQRLLNAMAHIPREEFIPLARKHLAYWDGPLSIGQGQTTPSPYSIAIMIETLNINPTDRVLEVGTGTGYSAAVMACMAQEVHTIEIIYDLYIEAENKLQNYDNVKVYYGDGSQGLHELAPFNKIILTAASKEFPEKLWGQLDEGGVMVAPITHSEGIQKLYRYRKVEGERIADFICDISLAPMISEYIDDEDDRQASSF